MAEHYYSRNPESKSAPKSWTFNLRGRTLNFSTDQGVFSKDEVDFGSRTLIETFAEPEINGEFLDLGCGYGPIGLSLALDFPDRKVVMVDVNERATQLAQDNAAKNNVKNADIVQSDQFSAIQHQSFAAIVTNPPIRAGKKVVHSMFDQSHQALLPGGELWVVIQKKQGAPSAKQHLEELFDQVTIEKKAKGYFILKAKKFDSEI